MNKKNLKTNYQAKAGSHQFRISEEKKRTCSSFTSEDGLD